MALSQKKSTMLAEIVEDEQDDYFKEKWRNTDSS